MLTLHKQRDQMGNTNDHEQPVKTTSWLPRCLRFSLWAQLFSHYSVLIALHNFFSLLCCNYSRINKLHSPLPISLPRLTLASILVRGHVRGITNCCCLCSRDAPGCESLWIIFTLPPERDLNLHPLVSMLHKESLRHSSGSSGSCSEEPHCLFMTSEAPGPPQVVGK